MNIDHEFTVPAPADRAWAMLTDLEQVATCMPGARLTGHEGDTYQGLVKVKVGPVTAEYRGTASFAEKDDDGYHAVVAAKGKEARGSGTAAATIDLRLRPDGEDRTVVSVGTDLKISGKLAQFGAGMIQEVSAKLLGQFTQCLESRISDGGSAGSGAGEPAERGDGAGTADVDDPSPAAARRSAAGAAATGATAAATTAAPATPAAGIAGTTLPVASAAAPRHVPAADADEPAAVDLVGLAGPALLKRLVPVLLGLVAVVVVFRWLRD
jgi:uncharacterized protein